MVAAALQFLNRFWRKSRFKMDASAAGRGWAAGWVRRADVVCARRIAGFLETHVEVEQVNENLHVALRLHVAAHDAEAHHGFTVLGDESRDDRVERALAGRVGIRKAG